MYHFVQKGAFALLLWGFNPIFVAITSPEKVPEDYYRGMAAIRRQATASEQSSCRDASENCIA